MPAFDRETLQILKDDGDMVVDRGAKKIGSHIFSDKLGGIAIPSRLPTLTFQHKELNRAPIPRSRVHFESKDPMPVDSDSQLIGHEMESCYTAARQGREDEHGVRDTHKFMPWVCLMVGTIAMLTALIWYVNLEEPPPPGGVDTQIAPEVIHDPAAPMAPATETPDAALDAAPTPASGTPAAPTASPAGGIPGGVGAAPTAEAGGNAGPELGKDN